VNGNEVRKQEEAARPCQQAPQKGVRKEEKRGASRQRKGNNQKIKKQGCKSSYSTQE